MAKAVSDDDSKPNFSMNSISQVPEGHSISLSTSIYSVEAVKKTAYKFADRTSIIINPGPDSTISLVFNFAGKYANNDRKQIIADFFNELLDQDLRERIKKETEPKIGRAHV